MQESAPRTDRSWEAASRQRIEDLLARNLPTADAVPQRLHQAMRYSVLGPGKRARPLLVYATADALGMPYERVDSAAMAVELIHAYSLIHDDLPAMDDDDLRRGRPTTHRAFDEATAILAGDALQVLAFEILAGTELSDGAAAGALAMIRVLAAASGTRGMAGGQAMDLAAVGQHLDAAQVEEMHGRKTGALIRATVQMVASQSAGLPAARQRALEIYAAATGLAFQIVDDLLDVLGDPAATGKTTGSDALRGKPTYPSAVGVEGARARVRELIAAALGALADFGPGAAHLREFARDLAARCP
jgi:farnesyl diphosphate synthase